MIRACCVRIAAAALAAALFAAGTAPVLAQGYRLRMDTRVQTATFRGVELDSIPSADAVTAAGGGMETADGYAVTCDFSGFCHFFRAGPRIRSAPVSQQMDVTAWGFGVPGVSVRANARALTDLSGGSDGWPGTEPALQLLEGYAEYARSALTVRGGRQMFSSRLGPTGFDGGRLLLRRPGLHLDGEVFGGWGLARATALPLTSPVLNPLDEYRPLHRGLVFGGALGWTPPLGSIRADYIRELESDSRYFISERLGLSGEVRPAPGWSVAGGAEYDLAQGWWGTADLQLRYASRPVTVNVTARRYRPHFDLWTIWGAFNPVPYTSASAAAWVRPLARLEIRGTAERYVFSPTSTATPLVDVEDRGWRAGLGATATLGRGWSADADLHAEFGPGASSRQLEGGVTYAPTARLMLSGRVASLRRPLELRFDDASVTMFSLDADLAMNDRWRIGAGAARYSENRQRPDAAAIDWNQTRLYARVSAIFGSGADRIPLPPGRRARDRGAVAP